MGHDELLGGGTTEGQLRISRDMEEEKKQNK